MKWRAVEGKENLFESDEDYTILRDTRVTPPRYLAFKRQYQPLTRVKVKKPAEGETPKEKPKPKWAPPLVVGGFDSGEEAKAACERHAHPESSAA